MATLTCKICGGKLVLDVSLESARCEQCGLEYKADTLRVMLTGEVQPQALNAATAPLSALQTADQTEVVGEFAPPAQQPIQMLQEVPLSNTTGMPEPAGAPLLNAQLLPVAQGTSAKAKQKVYKCWWFWVILAVVVLGTAVSVTFFVVNHVATLTAEAEKEAALAAERKAVLENYVRSQQGNNKEIQSNGITYIDEGDLVTVLIKYNSDSQPGQAREHPESNPSEQVEADMLATSLKTHVYILRYMSDGYLVEINAGFYGKYDDASEEVKALLASRMGAIKAAADELAIKNREIWLEAFKADLLLQHPTNDDSVTAYTEVSYSTEEGGIWINVRERANFGFTGRYTDEKMQEVKEGYTKAVQFYTLTLRTNVGIRFYYSTGELDFEVASPMQDYLYKPGS